MKAQHILRNTKRVVTMVLILSPMLWAGMIQADSTLDEQLVEAADLGNVRQVKALLSKKADVNARDKDGKTLLMSAAGRGDLEMVKLLIGKGAEVNAKDRWGRTSLTMASANNLAEVAELLLEKGADINVESPLKCEQGAICRWTPLMRAAYKGHADVVKLLLDHGR
jgi:uncharacterized protein